jgi:hypothetical protein
LLTGKIHGLDCFTAIQTEKRQIPHIKTSADFFPFSLVECLKKGNEPKSFGSMLLDVFAWILVKG